jgi:hypothetical protein
MQAGSSADTQEAAHTPPPVALYAHHYQIVPLGHTHGVVAAAPCSIVGSIAHCTLASRRFRFPASPCVCLTQLRRRRHPRERVEELWRAQREKDAPTQDVRQAASHHQDRSGHVSVGKCACNGQRERVQLRLKGPIRSVGLESNNGAPVQCSVPTAAMHARRSSVRAATHCMHNHAAE